VAYRHLNLLHCCGRIYSPSQRPSQDTKVSSKCPGNKLNNEQKSIYWQCFIIPFLQKAKKNRGVDRTKCKCSR